MVEVLIAGLCLTALVAGVNYLFAYLLARSSALFRFRRTAVRLVAISALIGMVYGALALLSVVGALELLVAVPSYEAAPTLLKFAAIASLIGAACWGMPAGAKRGNAAAR